MKKSFSFLVMSGLFLASSVSFANGYEQLLGKAVVCSKVTGFIGNVAGIASGFNAQGSLILKNITFSKIGYPYIVSQAYAKPASCTVLPDQD